MIVLGSRKQFQNPIMFRFGEQPVILNPTIVDYFANPPTQGGVFSTGVLPDRSHSVSCRCRANTTLAPAENIVPV